jgi:preprotein translocase subunit SecE
MLVLAGVLYLIWRRVGSAVKAFIGQTAAELQKCTWPWDPTLTGLKRYKELIDSSVIVVVAAIFLGAFVMSADFILMKVIGFIIRMH